MGDYAIIQAGGNQVKVTTGEKVRLEKLAGEPGTEVIFPNVLLLSTGGDAKVGQPYVAGASVKAEIVEHGRGKKISVVKYKPKVRYKKRVGHRQNFTKVKIKKI
jgi:large subunit ribosomal protein L21